MKMVSLVTLVFQSSMHVIMLRYSRLVPGPKYLASTAVVMSEVMKLFIALSIYFYEHRSFNGVSQQLFGPESKKWHMLLVALLYFVQNNAQYIALTHLEAATFQITNQLKLFTTAYFAVIMLNRSLSPSKWLALVILFIGVCLINLGPGPSHGDANPAVGLVAVAVSCGISGFAAAWFEKVLKSSNQSITLRNIQLALFSLVPGFLFAVCVVDGQQVRKNGFFHGYTIWTWFAIILQAFGGLVVAAVVKYADSILKGFATSLSIMLSSLASVWLFDFKLSRQFIIGTMLVLYATKQYMSGDNTEFKLDLFVRKRRRALFSVFAAMIFLSAVFVVMDGHADHRQVVDIDWDADVPIYNELHIDKHPLARAYVFVAEREEDACHALASRKQLLEMETEVEVDFAVIHHNISSNRLDLLNRHGFRTIGVDQNGKLKLFQDYGYEKIVYIHSKTLVINHMDALFHLPATSTFWASKDGSVIVVDPKKTEGLQKEYTNFDRLLEARKEEIGLLPNEYSVADHVSLKMPLAKTVYMTKSNTTQARRMQGLLAELKFKACSL